MDKMDQLLAKIDQFFGWLEDVLPKMQSDLAKVQADLATQQNEVAALKTSQVQIEVRLARLEANQEEHKTQTSPLEMYVNARSDAIKVRLDEQRQTVNALIPTRLTTLPGWAHGDHAGEGGRLLFPCPVGDGNQFLQCDPGTAFIHGSSGLNHAFLEIDGPARHHQAGCGIEQCNVAKGTGGTIEQGPQGSGIVGRVAALQVFGAGRREPDRLWGDGESTDLPIPVFGDIGRTGGGDLVQTVMTVHHPNTFGAQTPQNLGQWLHPVCREDADHLTAGTGWIRQRSQQVEDGADAKLGTDGHDMAHGTVVTGRHHEADPGFGQGFAHQREIGVNVDTECFQHIGRAGSGRQGLVAMFCN